MEFEGYLCYADSPSRSVGRHPDGISCPGVVFWDRSWEHCGYFHSEKSGICYWECPHTYAGLTNVPYAQKEDDSWSKQDNMLFSFLTIWIFAVELILLYVAFWAGCHMGRKRSEGIEKVKLSAMTDLGVSASKTILPPLPKKSEGTEQSSSPEPRSDSGSTDNGTEERPVSPPPEGSPTMSDVLVKAAENPAETTEDSANAAVDGAAENTPNAAMDPGKVAWDTFTKAFANRDPHEPFPPLEKAHDISEEEIDSLLADESLGICKLLASCRKRTTCREIAREFLARFPEPETEWPGASVLRTADEDTTYWVAGDVHAKVSAIAKICAVIAARRSRGLTKTRNVLVLLGDYVDRGDEPLETLAFIEHLKIQPLFDGFEVITLKGNHDVGLSRNEDGEYASMVSPAETAEFLRARTREGDDVSVEAEAAMRLAAVSPRMCELTGIDLTERNRTILFVHGGVPHVDLQERLYAVRNHIPQGEPFFKAISEESIPDNLRKGCAEDFTWIRFSKDLPEKKPNRGSRGCEIGTENVAQYLFLHRALTSRDITFIFRGHDHERSGFACYSPHPILNPTKKRYAQKECTVLTLNAMEPDLSSSGMFRERDLALAEWTIGAPVRLYRIQTHHLEVAKSVPPALGRDEPASPAQPEDMPPDVDQPEESPRQEPSPPAESEEPIVEKPPLPSNRTAYEELNKMDEG